MYVLFLFSNKVSHICLNSHCFDDGCCSFWGLGSFNDCFLCKLSHIRYFISGDSWYVIWWLVPMGILFLHVAWLCLFHIYCGILHCFKFCQTKVCCIRSLQRGLYCDTIAYCLQKKVHATTRPILWNTC